jgi:RNA polymerase primary sigma factor
VDRTASARTAPHRCSPGTDGFRGPLPPGDERRLVVRAAGGDAAARERLVELFVPSVAAVARRYKSLSAVDRGELTQEGVVGLLRALERYDPERGTPFWAYASWWVRQAMQQLVAEMTRPVVLSDRALRLLARVKEARREYQQARGRDPSTRELAEAAGVPLARVEELLAVDRPPRALDEPLGRTDEPAAPLGELLADPVAEDAYDRVVGRVAIAELREPRPALAERERAVLRDRYGIGGPPRTLREIGGSLGLSAERVRQIEEGALGKLRAAACDPTPKPSGWR